MNRDTLTNEYRFNEKRHLHELRVEDEWKALTGCTTILSVLAKPALIQWAANEAVGYVTEWVNSHPKPKDTDLFLRGDELLKKLQEAKTAHLKKKEKAGDWGTEMHSWVETFIGGLITGEHGVGLPKDELQAKGAEHFIKWATDNKVKFLESEKHIYSKELFIGGVVDMVFEIDGQTWIGDIKTGSGIYFEAFWQMAGYHLMLKEMGLYPDITGYIVLNLKKDGTFDEKRSVSNEDNIKGFMSCLEIYRIQQKINNLIIH